MNTTEQRAGGRIRDWKGLLHGESRAKKLQVFLALLVLSTSMTFTQFGFIGVGAPGKYLAHALGLLAPLAAAALLLGKGTGTLFGLVSGGVLYAHARLQPLDLYERYIVSVLNSFVLYAFAGFLLGLAFAIALHNNPKGKRRYLYLAAACAISSVVMSVAFFGNSLVTLALSIIPAAQESTNLSVSSELVGSFSVISGLDLQALCDFLLMLGI